MSFSNIEIRNFRAFRRLSMSGLGKVNFIVGSNGCGKSTLLEAAAINATAGDLGFLRQLALSHDLGTPVEGSELILYTPKDFTHLKNTERIEILLDQRGLICDWIPGSEEPALSYIPEALGKLTPDLYRRLDNSLMRFYVPGPDPAQQTFVDRSLDWIRLDRLIAVPYTLYSKLLSATSPMAWVGSHSPLDRMAHLLWNRAVEQGREMEIEQALRCLFPELVRLNFLTRSSGSDTHVVPIASFPGKVLPLKALGDGALRAFQLAIAALSARGGLLLIDEIETGLHHSILCKLLAQLFELMEKHDVQALITTHSQETIRNAVTAAGQMPGLDLRLFRLEDLGPEGHHVFAFDFAQLASATRQELEVR